MVWEYISFNRLMMRVIKTYENLMKDKEMCKDVMQFGPFILRIT
jgi:hypothetical protein